MRARIGGHAVEVDESKVVGGVDSDTQRKDRRTVRRERAVNGSEPIVQFSAPQPPPGWPKPSDKWNYSFCQFLELEKQAGRIKHWWYEPFALWLPGEVRYRPDFLIQYPDGLERKLHFVEVKGFSRNVRDGITRYKIAAALFPCFTWSMVKRKGNGWEEYT